MFQRLTLVSIIGTCYLLQTNYHKLSSLAYSTNTQTSNTRHIPSHSQPSPPSIEFVTSFTNFIDNDIVAAAKAAESNKLTAEALEFSRISGTQINKTNAKRLFNKFMFAFDKVYNSSLEFDRRFAIFINTLLQVTQSWRDFEAGRSTYALGLNQFSDWDDQELKSLLALRAPPSRVSPHQIGFNLIRDSDDNSTTTTTTTSTTKKPTTRPSSPEDNEFKYDLFPEYVNWHHSKCVLEPMNQGTCGSCYAFAALSIIESMQCIRRLKLPIRLSPQQVLDCVSGNETHGCSGGWPGDVFEYFAKNFTLSATIDCYPYTHKSDGKCRASELIDSQMVEQHPKQHPKQLEYLPVQQTLFSGNKTHDGGKNSTKVDEKKALCFTNASPNRRKLKYREIHTKWQMMHYLATNGPIVGTLEALASFQKYSHGIYQDSNCKSPGSDDNINHALSIIGYGTVNGTDYWLVKNSWGTNWGKAGYGRIVRGNNTCSIESVAWAVLA